MDEGVDLILYFDGGTIGNRICVYDSGLKEEFEYSLHKEYNIGELEYLALHMAIVYYREKYTRKVSVMFVGDSKMVVDQVNGKRVPVGARMIELHSMIWDELYRVGINKGNLRLKWVKRIKNKAGRRLDKKRREE